jgi:hypothetical protein
MANKEDINNGAKFKLNGRIGTAYAVTPKSKSEGYVNLLFEGQGNVTSGEDYAPPSGYFKVDVLELVEPTQNIWKEIRDDFEDDTHIFIDAWLTDDENESGAVIVKVDKKTRVVEYLNERAKTDKLAQEIINEVLTNLK